MVYTKENFPAIKSEPSWFWTWVIRVLFSFLFSVLIIFFFIEPVLLYIEEYIYGVGAIIFMFLYYPLLIWACITFVKYIKKVKKNYVNGVTVNNKGLHFQKINGETQSIFYSQLQKSNNRYTSDVFTETIGRHGETLLYVHLNGSKQSVYFNKTDIAFTYYTGNYKKLRTHFIQGVKLFRPDLIIDKAVYSSFYIDPRTYEFDRKMYWKVVAIVFVLMVLLLFAIEWYVTYRTGQSLLF